MAKIRIPPPDVAPIDPKTGLWTNDWYDVVKALERLGVLDLLDVDNSTPPTNTQVLIWNSTTGKFTPGAN